MTEEWKPIPGYEGYYEASSLGRIRSVERTVIDSIRGYEYVLNERILRQGIGKRTRGKGNDCKVGLSKYGSTKTHYVSRLVAMAFLPNPEGKRTVNHIDGNPMNNNVNNLEWATDSENVIHALDNELNKTRKKVLLHNDNETISFDSISSANKFLKRNSGYIRHCIDRGINPKSPNGNVYEVTLC